MALTTTWRRTRGVLRMLRHLARAVTSTRHPVLAHLIVTRRCNLACAYCNEFDAASAPVPLADLEARVDDLARLGTSVVTISGGEPLLSPWLEAVITRLDRHGIVPTLITNGYLLTPERIAALGRAGLQHLQISIDNVEPDETSKKSLRLLEPKLRWLSEQAEFSVAINSVVGSAIRDSRDALAVDRRARELGFARSVGIIHDGDGQLAALPPEALAIYQELSSGGLMRLNATFQRRLAQGQPNEWRCRAGARYLYVDEDGMVSYCSQQRGTPGIPLSRYGAEDLRRAYETAKDCAPYCTVNCVQQVGLLDNWRDPQADAVGVPLRPKAVRA